MDAPGVVRHRVLRSDGPHRRDRGRRLTRLEVPSALTAERGRSASIDVGRSAGPFAWNATCFASWIDDPLVVDRDDGYRLRQREPYAVTGSCTFVRGRESDGGAERDVALTPRLSAGLVAMIESEDRGRVGLEVSVTGRQQLEADPYRATSERYVVVGLLAERRIGRLSVFVNGENLTGTRQSRWDALLRPSRAPDGRWTVDAWAPLDGRVVNGGVRVRFR